MISYIGGITMNKAIVIYSSKTGFTRKYAKWICDALDADILEFNDRNRVYFSWCSERKLWKVFPGEVLRDEKMSCFGIVCFPGNFCIRMSWLP